MFDELADDFYEAAFNSEKWPRVIDRISRFAGAASGMLMVFDDIRPTKHVATGRALDLHSKLIETETWKQDRRIPFFFKNPLTGFVFGNEYFPPEIARDATYELRRTLDLDHEIGTIVPMPSGELVVFVLHRLEKEGAFDRQMIGHLNRLHAHFARSAYVATRLGLERARSAVSTLQSLGVPAAAVARGGRVVANNALLESVTETLIPLAFGGIGLARPASNKLLQEAIAAVLSDGEAVTRSIPVPAEDDQPAMVIHVLPLRHSASDLFSGADALIATTTVSASRFVPSPQVLMGLFDLTPTEVRLASALARGLSLQEAASANGIQISTARSYLESIFRKTGTRRQSHLVALLKGTQLT